MPLYYYIAKTPKGKTVKDIEEFPSREDLIRRLKEQDFFIISVRKIEKEKEPSLFRFFTKKRKHKGVRLVDLVFFARNLSTTLSAGMPLLRSLEIISSQVESIKLSQTLREIVEDIRKGLSLSEAIKKHGNVFSSLWRGITEVGETSGNLPLVLERLADYLERRLDFERKIKSSLIYPAILLTAAFIAMGVFFKVVMPRFSSIFDEFKIQLPKTTVFLLNLSKFVDRNFLLLLGIFILVILIVWNIRKYPFFKRKLDGLILELPLISHTFILAYLERFSSTMYILLDSGVPIVYTLEITARSIGNSILERDIQKMKENVKKGRSLSSELANNKFIPPLVSEITRIGEEAGNLSEMLKKISTYYQKELASRIERMIALFEPVVILIMGLIIGFIVISLFLPLFKLSTMGGLRGF
ncbi:MAG: type II secretion system F family protein [Candidatus Omnitrophica bacterium]|nr:type II secretion system F family protein [Candidatus Omnitrophota bacterium]